MCADEEAGWLLRQAQERGVKLSHRQLAEWHRAGLIPKPLRTFGRPHGSTSFYPFGTLQQALACYRLIRRHRHFKTVGWLLWTEGFPVADVLWRGPFIEAQKLFLSVERFLDTEDAGEHDIAQALEHDSEMMRIVRRQVRGARSLVLMSRVLVTVIKAFHHALNDPESAEQVDVLRRLFGISKKADGAFRAEDVAVSLDEMTYGISRIPSFNILKIDCAYAAECCKEYKFLLYRADENALHAGFAKRILMGIIKALVNSSPKQEAAAILVWMAVRPSGGVAIGA